MIPIKYKKLHKDAVEPKKAHPEDVGFDVVATDLRADLHEGIFQYSTGLAFEIPAGYELQVRPRSSIRGRGIVLANAPGTIDSNYRGEVLVTFTQVSWNINSIYRVGDKIAQLVLQKVPQSRMVEVDELSITDRGTGGHGSTGV